MHSHQGRPIPCAALQVCYSRPYAATIKDVDGGSCELLGDYGSGTKWACAERMGANCEEEWINGKLVWGCYVH